MSGTCHSFIPHSATRALVSWEANIDLDHKFIPKVLNGAEVRALCRPAYISTAHSQKYTSSLDLTSYSSSLSPQSNANSLCVPLWSWQWVSLHVNKTVKVKQLILLWPSFIQLYRVPLCKVTCQYVIWKKVNCSTVALIQVHEKLLMGWVLLRMIKLQCLK